MKFFSERELIRTVAERWGRVQGRNDKINEKDYFEIYKKLVGLGLETATVEDVKNIIGNYTWCELTCNECGEKVEAAVQIGQPPMHNSETAMVCLPCLLKALLLFQDKLQRGINKK